MNLLKLNNLNNSIITFGDGCPACDSEEEQGGVTATIDDNVANEENNNQDIKD